MRDIHQYRKSIKKFVEKDSSGNSGQPPVSSSSQATPSPEYVRFTLTGTQRAVTRTIQLLHCRQVILGSEWSSAVPIKNSSDVVCVAVRMI